ncbi:hypothetical protein [Frondihabitans cladoniiphilus]|uniref:Alkaline shock family protein YloU n=1 Tax=Frondihabitans cladoniiphilus TaxID=715785 RepID=A0ABP8W238_9MICO
MSNASFVQSLALELGDLVAGVPGVARVQARPGVGRLAKRVLGGLTSAVGSGLTSAVGGALPGSSGSGADSAETAAPREPDVALTVTEASTLVELDVAIDGSASGPSVVRAVATGILARLALEPSLPPASVDVRIVSIL